MSTIYDQRYVKLVDHLIAIRKKAKFSQAKLAASLGLDQSTISKVESFDRRIDIIELHDWLTALGFNHQQFLIEAGWLNPIINAGIPALPVPGKAIKRLLAGVTGTAIEMAWQGEKKEVFIPGLPVKGYLKLERDLTLLYRELNGLTGSKNREAIFKALSLAFEMFPAVNPSDLYHHIVYRLYLREYTKTQADRSWVRAGGEAFELFLEHHYGGLLKPAGISIKWLKNDELRRSALREMGISGEVGGSKLDLALYGKVDGRQFIFGGIHAKASLAERVSDDVPCSTAMMRRGFVSYLVTLDAKSFPPPSGDLVNRGELGTIGVPSDKRAYIEAHGSFDACFSYNLRSVASRARTASGKRIFVSTFEQAHDALPTTIKHAWAKFAKNL